MKTNFFRSGTARAASPRLLTALFLALAGVVGSGMARADVYLNPGDDVQGAVNANGENTVFHLSAGTYNNQSIIPKNGDVFQGDSNGGTTFYGGRVLTSFGRSGNYYTVTGQTQEGQTMGQTESGWEGSLHPEDLFFDNTVLKHVTSLDQVGPGSWYFDYPNDTIYFSDNPAGHTVETTVTRSAFYTWVANNVSGVGISNISFTKYANPAQVGVVGGQYGGGAGWTVQNCRVFLNHGVGIVATGGWQVLSNQVVDNGEGGINGYQGYNILVKGNDVERNNYAHFFTAWEGGGGKFAQCDTVNFDGNTYRANHGVGMWTDINCINITYQNNIVEDNYEQGIMHEIGYKCSIHDNTLRRNGSQIFSWLWGGQILLSNSQNCEVYNNTLELGTGNGNGITIVNADRTGDPNYSPQYGAWVAQNNYIHNNTTTVPHAPVQQNGAFAGLTGGVTSVSGQNVLGMNNHWDYNTYKVTDPSAAYWNIGIYGQGQVNWSNWNAAGQDVNGSVLTLDPSNLTAQ